MLAVAYACGAQRLEYTIPNLIKEAFGMMRNGKKSQLLISMCLFDVFLRVYSLRPIVHVPFWRKITRIKKMLVGVVQN